MNNLLTSFSDSRRRRLEARGASRETARIACDFALSCVTEQDDDLIGLTKNDSPSGMKLLVMVPSCRVLALKFFSFNLRPWKERKLCDEANNKQSRGVI